MNIFPLWRINSIHSSISCGGELRVYKIGDGCALRALIWLLVVVSQQLIAQQPDKLISFDIPQERAELSLTKFAEQADRTFVFPYDQVEGIMTNRLIGDFTLEVAINQLLEGTDLSPAFSDDGLLTIKVEENEMNLRQKTGIMASLLASLGITVDIAVAQDTGGQAQIRTLEEIVVTARKREESLTDVPVAISVLTETAIAEAGIDEIGEIMNNTVGMVYNERDGNRASAQPGVRGITSITGGPSQTIERISTFIDGMPMVGPQATIQFVDVAGVEVYRGPQSAVFGRAVFAGALNYSLREPSLTDSEGAINSQIGQDGRSAVSGYYSAPIVEDVLGFYLSAARDKYDGPDSIMSTDGYRMGSRDTEHYSGAFTYEPTDALSMTLRYTSTMLDDGPAADYNLDPALDSNIIPSPAGTFDAPIYAGELDYIEDPVLARNFCFNEGLAFQDCVRDPGWELERERLAFNLDYDLDNGHSLSFRTFTSEDTIFDIDDQDNTAVGGAADNNPASRNAVNMGTDVQIEEDYYELIWTSPDAERLRYTLGFSSYDYTSDTTEWFRHPSSTLNGTEAEGTGRGDSEFNISNTGVFAGVFYDLTDELTLSFEGRQQQDDISANDPDPTDAFVPEAKSSSFLPRLSLTYAMSEEINLYAQYAEGVQPATVNAQAVNTQQRALAAALEGLVVDGETLTSAEPFLDGLISVEEEVLYNYEVGMKGVFLDGRMNLNVALFQIETDGYAETQNMFFNPAGSDLTAVVDALNALPGIDGVGNTSLRVRGSLNTGDLISRGFEVDGAYLLNDNWELSGQLTYLNTKFDSACIPIGADFGLDDSTLDLPGGVSLPCTTVDGNAFPLVPELQYGLAATYTDELSNGMDWFARLDMRFEDEQYLDWFESGWLPSSTKFNLRAGINVGAMRLEAYVENLTDDRTPYGGHYSPDRKQVIAVYSPPLGYRNQPQDSTGLNIAVAPPREIGLKVSLNF